MPKVRILHLIESLGSGGAEKLLYTNLKHLDSRRFESEVMTVFPRADFWKQRIEELGVSVSSLGCTKASDLPFAAVRLFKYLKRSRPDVIHTHLWAANIIGRTAGRAAHVPVVSSVHNPEYEPEVVASSRSNGKLHIARALDKFTARFACSRMLAVSSFVRESTVRNLGYPSDRIEMIYNPIDQCRGDDKPSRRAEIRSELGLEKDSLLLLNVARLSPQKGFIFAVRAMPMVLEKFPRAVLLSIGAHHDQAWTGSIRSEITKLGLDSHVKVLGERRDIPAYLRECDLFVFPSLFEGLGIALAEAMANGCCCIANDIKPLDEFMVDNVNGRLVRVENPNELAGAIIELLGDPFKRSRLGTKAAITASELFSPELAAQRLQDLYLSVIGVRKSEFSN